MPIQPRVTVFIASYNHARYLPACLDSILHQTYTDFEIVVVDDGSTDGSHEILVGYHERYPSQVRYLHHPGRANRGISATCNLALRHAQGEYLAWIGSDDLWREDKLERQVAQLDQDPQLGLVYSLATFIDSDGQDLAEDTGVDISAEPDPVTRMIQSCYPPAMTVMLRKACFAEIEGFDETLVYSDWELWIRILSHWKAGFLNRSLAWYRLHTHNISKGIDPQVHLNRTLLVMQALLEKSPQVGGLLCRPRNQAMLHLQITLLEFCAGREAEAIEALRRAFAADPELACDAGFLHNWVISWKPDFYTIQNPHLGFWVLAHLPAQVSSGYRERVMKLQLESEDTRKFFFQRGLQAGKTLPVNEDLAIIFADCPAVLAIDRAWKQAILKKVYPVLLFDRYQARDFPRARLFWQRTIQSDPAWLLNRGVRAIAGRLILARLNPAMIHAKHDEA